MVPNNLNGRHRIAGGPDAQGIEFALFDPDTMFRTVTFTVEIAGQETQLLCCIHSVSRFCRHGWVIQGHVVEKTPTQKMIRAKGDFHISSYMSHDRSGTMEITGCLNS
jgi:hypothetical protein